jgi:SAM-dependent methyltransferase
VKGPYPPLPRRMSTNAYSPEWFDLFAEVPREQTEREAAFVDSLLPPAARVLDLACGPGRHAVLLQARGHHVVGLDRSHAALGAARKRAPGASWVRADLRALPLRVGSFDAVLSLWQSFGYFDEEGNRDALRRIRDLLRADGALIMDLYHGGFFEQCQGQRRFERKGTPVLERKTLARGRLRVDLEYGRTGGGDRFDWQVFTPGEFSAFVGGCGLRIRSVCTDFDLTRAPTPRLPRVQYVLEPA